MLFLYAMFVNKALHESNLQHKITIGSFMQNMMSNLCKYKIDHNANIYREINLLWIFFPDSSLFFQEGYSMFW